MSVLSFDECAVILTLVFLIAYIMRRQYLNGRTNRIMVTIVFLIFLSSLADLGFGAIDVYGYPAPWLRVVYYAVNYLYFVSRNIIPPLFVLYLYSSIDIWHVFVSTKVRNALWFAPFAVSMAVLLLNGFVFDVFSVTEECKYVRGPFLSVLYLISAVYGIWGIVVTIKYRKLLNKDKFAVLIFMYAIIFSGMFIQMFHPKLLIESFCMALALLFFMVMVKREEDQIDPMTGATKYNVGIERITRNFISRKPVSLIFVKIVNHSNIRVYLGQTKFVEFLRSITAALNSVSREKGFTSEIYYFERGLFAYLGDRSDEELLAQISEAAREALTRPFNIDGFLVMPDVRLCVTDCPDEIEDLRTLYSLALTFHNTMPNNREVQFYRDFCNDNDFKIRNDMNAILSRALENNGFQMYYQPIYSTVENRFVAAEALIRLKDRYYGNISPALFIPMAEKSGAIHDIGDYVIKTVLKFISDLDMEELGLYYIELNLSASQCIEVDLVERIQSFIEDHGIRPENVGLELTETAADINPEIVDNNIRKLHDYGVRIALDDFGTGYSNVRRVTTLPIDQVKMDKSFVDMVDDPQMWIVIQDTIGMLREMGKEVLVEGIEEERVARMFTDINTDLIQGCELIQGFYFCKPVPKDEFVEFIRKHRQASEADEQNNM
ncbi:MAG: EAL domain-containing protein [Lachnospiraceae bacterium]|nr:EAL domain-containing protein [Lachnospiraceae bacterium]